MSSQIRELSKTSLSIWSDTPRIPSSLHSYLHQSTAEPSSPDSDSGETLSRSTSLPFRQSPSVPAEPAFSSSSMATHYDLETWDTPSVESSTVLHQSSVASEDHRENSKYSVVSSLQELSSRGRGIGPYACPYRDACRKGGVESNGQLKLFQRNSDFKAHLEKHEKPFKCDLPGCPKPERGFARADQLERHKQKVAHDIYGR